MTRQAATIAAVAGGILILVAVTVGVVVSVTVDQTPPPAPAAPASDPVRELAEQELRLEREAQETSRRSREGLQRQVDTLKADGDDPFAPVGGREAYEREQAEELRQARDSKARANGFETWEAYQQHLQSRAPATAAD